MLRLVLFARTRNHSKLRSAAARSTCKGSAPGSDRANVLYRGKQRIRKKTIWQRVHAAPVICPANGVEDVVIAARCKNPLIDQAEHDYKVLDPYDSFYGFGDPKVTTKFSEEDPLYRGLVLLIIHGAGSDGWRAEATKSKFVIINLPFKQLAVKKLTVHKKPVMAIYAEEATADGATSVIFFDGKKYKYQPMGSSME